MSPYVRGEAQRARDRESARRCYERDRATEEGRAALRAKSAAWRAANPDLARSMVREINKRRKATDVCFRLKERLRERLRLAAKGRCASGAAIRSLGCSIEELKAHLERQFQPGMTWDTWDQRGWHIDHKKPLSSFDLTDPAQVAHACHFSNLQPLWWRQNISKHWKERNACNSTS